MNRRGPRVLYNTEYAGMIRPAFGTYPVTQLRNPGQASPFDPRDFGTTEDNLILFLKCGDNNQWSDEERTNPATDDGNWVYTIENLNQVSPDPLVYGEAISDATRARYYIDAYSSGYPAWYFDGVGDIIRWLNVSLAFEDMNDNGATVIFVFNSVTQYSTYGVGGLSSIPNKDQYGAGVWHDPDGNLQLNSLDSESEPGLANVSRWNPEVGEYDYIDTDGPHYAAVTLDNKTNKWHHTYSYNDKQLVGTQAANNMAIAENWSTFTIGAVSWQEGTNYGEGYVHAVLVYDEALAAATIVNLINTMKREWYP